MFRQIAFVGIVLFTVSVGMSNNAFAQQASLCNPGETQGNQDVACAVTTSTSVVGLTTTGGIILTVYLITRNKRAAVEDYFRRNAVAIIRDSALGAGETVRDLHFILGVPDSLASEFGGWIRAHRGAVAKLTTQQASDVEFQRFLDDVANVFGTAQL